MKKYIALFLALLLICCVQYAVKTNPSGDQLPPESVTPMTPVVLTELEVQNMFLACAEPGWIMIDCIPVSDSSHGIVGVVQYTTEDYPGCRFDFLTMSGPKVVGVGSRPASEDRLLYQGGDTVSCELLEKDGQIYTCTITYYKTDEEVGFEISSQRR